ncbi:MAG: hypothetical protein ACPGSD_01815 [Flavobacteriales bacterium]
MYIENNGVKIDGVFIPPFTLDEGEIVVLSIPNDERFFKTEMLLRDVFIGNIPIQGIKINTKFTFVEHWSESKLKQLLKPCTVGKYLKRNANVNDAFALRIYENDWIKETTKVHLLAGTKKRQLCLFATLSKTNNIIIDLLGTDPKGSFETLKIVQKAVKKKGSAILIDCFENINCNFVKYVKVQTY